MLVMSGNLQSLHNVWRDGVLENYEKLGSFFLGREVDPQTRKSTDSLFLYDSRDLVTHAVCIGMTGSGKTGLCIVSVPKIGYRLEV